MDPSGLTSGGLLAAAAQAVRTDPTVLGQLSPLSQVYLAGLGSGIEAQLGTALEQMGTDVLAQVTDSLGSEVTAAIQDVASSFADEVPVVGAFVGFFASMVQAMTQNTQPSAAQVLAATEQDEASRPVIATGPHGIMPADIFALVYPPNAAVTTLRSDLGMALCSWFEVWEPSSVRYRGPDDGYSPTEADHAKLLATFPAWLAREVVLGQSDYSETGWTAADLVQAPHAGIPIGRRRVLGLLRRIIERQWYPESLPPPYHGIPDQPWPRPRRYGDGGAAGWSLYLDLVLAEQRAGHIPDAWLAFLGSNGVVHPNGQPAGGELDAPGDGSAYVADGMGSGYPLARKQLGTMLTQWRELVFPGYGQALAEFRDIQGQARRMAARVAALLAPRRTVVSLGSGGLLGWATRHGALAPSRPTSTTSIAAAGDVARVDAFGSLFTGGQAAALAAAARRAGRTLIPIGKGAGMIAWRTLSDGSVEVTFPGKTPEVIALPPGEQPNVDRTLRWRDVAEAEAARQGVPPAWVLACILSESGGRATVVAKDGGTGLMQLTPPSHFGLTAAQALDGPTNIRAGTGLLAKLARAHLALPQVASGYNAGTRPDGTPHASSSDPWGMVETPGTIERYVRASNTFVRLGVSGVVSTAPNVPSGPPSSPPTSSPASSGGDAAVALAGVALLAKLGGLW